MYEYLENFDDIIAEQKPSPSHLALKVKEYSSSNNLKTMLELAPGRGEDALFFSSIGMNVTVLDVPSVTYVDVFDGPLPKKGIIKDIGGIGRMKDTFDCVYAKMSLHYFTDANIEEVFAGINKVLNVGGFFFTECRSIKDTVKIQDQKNIDNKEGRYFFTKEYLQEKAHIFDIIEIYGKDYKMVDGRDINTISFIARKKN